MLKIDVNILYLPFRYEELLNEERLTTQEVDALEKRFESWANAPPIQIPKSTRATSAPISSHRDVTKDLPPEVAAFEVSHKNHLH